MILTRFSGPILARNESLPMSSDAELQL